MEKCVLLSQISLEQYNYNNVCYELWSISLLVLLSAHKSNNSLLLSNHWLKSGWICICHCKNLQNIIHSYYSANSFNDKYKCTFDTQNIIVFNAQDKCHHVIKNIKMQNNVDVNYKRLHVKVSTRYWSVVNEAEVK